MATTAPRRQPQAPAPPWLARLGTSYGMVRTHRGAALFLLVLPRPHPWRPNIRLLLETSMYGRIFESMFTGSMVGSGPLVFAVWAYVLAHERDGLVELNLLLFATIIGAFGG